MNIHAVFNQAAAQQTVKVKASKDDAAPAAQNPIAASKPQPKDTVQISSTAQQALQEAMETKAQTAKEAQNGDAQARRLLAKENVAQASQQPATNPASEGTAEKLLK